MSWGGSSSRIMKYWREAASLILASRGANNTAPGGYRVLMLERSDKTHFMPSAHVFPGGVIEPADSSLSMWLQVFRQVGVDLKDLQRMASRERSKTLPPIFDVEGTTEDVLPREVSLRISAIRETFEECGLLLCTKGKGGPGASRTEVDRLGHWMERVRNSPEEFARLCRESKCCPDLWGLHEWSNWLTPSDMGPRRYDTAFFIAVMDDMPSIQIDEKEVVKMHWSKPSEALSQYHAKTFWLAPPQVYELSRLLSVPTASALLDFAVEREKLGMERLLPVRKNCADGLLSILPGDELYPAAPDLCGDSDVEQFNITMEDLRQKYPRGRRLEFCDLYHVNIYTNLQGKRFGHENVLRQSSETPQSHL